MKQSTLLFAPSRLLLGLIVAGLGLLSACSYTSGYKNDPAPACSTVPAAVSYKANVLPIFQSNCYRCHRATEYQSKANFALNMEDFSQVAQWSNPATGLNGVSYMVGNIRHDPGFIAMPYDGVGNLDACQIAIIKAWVDAGAPNN